MTNNKQTQKSGAHSTNVQVDTVNNYGISYVDVREIALQTFKDNFYELSESAKKIALERAEELISSFLDKLEKESPSLINKIQEPDIQYAVINAQKQYARSGGPDTLELLSDLLKYRFQAEEGSLKGIVLNESIEVMPKLTTNQIKLITALFLVKNCKLTKARYLIENLSKVMTDKLSVFQNDPVFFEHLIFVGVAAKDVSVRSSQNLEYFIREYYSDELENKIEGSSLSELDPPIRKQFITDSLSESVFEKWNNSYVNGYSLTSVGKAIAVAYYNTLMNASVDLDIWIKS